MTIDIEDEARLKQQETWECTVAGRVSMTVLGARDRPERRTVRGKGQRLRLTTGQRLMVEEAIRDVQNNPFANGKLHQVAGPPREPLTVDQDLGPQDLTDDDLATFFGLDITEFTEGIKALSKANVFRLNTLMRDRAGTVLQQETLREYIEEQYPITSGDTESYREMRQEASRG